MGGAQSWVCRGLAFTLILFKGRGLPAPICMSWHDLNPTCTCRHRHDSLAKKVPMQAAP